MPMKKVIMMLVAGCVVGMLTGCGVPKEEHEAKLAELNDAWQEIETLKAEKAEVVANLEAEAKKARSIRIELDDAKNSVTELQEKEAATASALAAEKNKVAELEGDLSAANSATKMAQDHGNELQAALDQLKDEYAHLQNRFDQLKKNMLALGGSTATVPAEKPKAADAPAPAAKTSSDDSKSALDLLDEMGAE